MNASCVFVPADRDEKLEDPMVKPEMYRDTAAFNGWIVGFIFNIAFIYMHNLK